jgi:hypothetical protein
VWETQLFSVVPNSSSAGNGNDGSVCPSQTYFFAESCYHCCYVATAAMFSGVTLPHPRPPEIKWNARGVIISEKHNIKQKFLEFTHFPTWLMNHNTCATKINYKT